MKKKFLLFSLIGLVALSGCKNGGTDVTTDKEAALQRAMKPYVENTVVATYSRMADEGMKLLDKCQQILAKQEAGQDYADLMKAAGTDWRAMRKYWEQSEAFLYGFKEQVLAGMETLEGVTELVAYVRTAFFLQLLHLRGVVQ